MGGKASLLLVIGFSLLFMIFGRNFNSMAYDTLDNFSRYFYKSKAHSLALVGINIMSNRLWRNASYNVSPVTINFDGGTITTTLATVNAVQNIRTLTSVGKMSITNDRLLGDDSVWTSTIRIVIQPSMFSRFAYFSDSEGVGINWGGRDTVWGPFHTNGNLLFNGNAIFHGTATYGGTITYNGYSPVFYQGLFNNNSEAMPLHGVDTVGNHAAGGASFTGTSSLNQLYMDFRGDSVRYRWNNTGSYTYKKASTFSPDGVIYGNGVDMHIKGIVKGRYTVASNPNSTNAYGGNIYIEDNLTYNTNPKTNPASTDMLGIVAKKSIIISDVTYSPPHSSITIQAAMYAETVSFTAQNYNTTPYKGTIFLYGGVTQNIRGAVGTGSGSTVNTGYGKSYNYDTRLLYSYPPSFPGTGFFQISSWFEE
jgi:hypothetical protein